MSVGRSLDLPIWNSITAVFPGVSAGRGRAAVDGLLGAERLAAAPSRRNPSVFLTGEDCTGTFSETPNRRPAPSSRGREPDGQGPRPLPGNALPALPAPWTAGPRGARPDRPGGELAPGADVGYGFRAVSAIGAAVARFVHTEEVTGSIPVSRTSTERTPADQPGSSSRSEPGARAPTTTTAPPPSHGGRRGRRRPGAPGRAAGRGAGVRRRRRPRGSPRERGRSGARRRGSTSSGSRRPSSRR